MAKRKSLLYIDDKGAEINQMVYVVKQDLSSLNSQITELQALSRQQQPKGEEGEHRKNVVFLLQGKVSDVAANFKDVLEVSQFRGISQVDGRLSSHGGKCVGC